MLTAIVLYLDLDRGPVPDGYLGRANYAQTLGRIHAYDAALAAAIHDEDGVKPIACSGVIGAGSQRTVSLQGERFMRVRVSATSVELSKCLRACFLDDPPAEWELDRRRYAVKKVVCDAQADPWSGSSTCEELVKSYLSDSSRLVPAATLHIASPLCFKSNGMTMALPLPGLFFGNLLERWNKVSPLAFDEEMRGFANQWIGVSHFSLQSEAVRQKNQALRIGSVGSVTYRALTSDRYWVGAMQSLVDFAFYSGVGAQTSTGMGMVRR